jgi:hypothetical protein
LYRKEGSSSRLSIEPILDDLRFAPIKIEEGEEKEA